MVDRDEEIQGSVGRWGDVDAPRHPRAHRHHQEGKRRFELHRFVQIGPKPLLGGETPEVAEDWIERIENCFHAFKCSEDQKMEVATFLLEGCARKWWKSASTPVLEKHGHVWWPDFCRLFCQLYFSPALRQVKAIELINMKHGFFSVDEYKQKFIDLLLYFPHIGSSSEAKYDNFLQGLNQKIFLLSHDL
ncbi:uncharacterized protein [Henckelia pumila]|uniref:uncharacterized protein n=1 Tax=Henckelia pumila TaxID=405737 RepID=UPI003C6E8290